MNGAMIPATRGHRHQCGNCGQSMKKAKRIFGEIPFCDNCYARDFLRRPCSQCGEPALLHKSQETGLCRKCERLTWKCLRCERPVKRAALLVAGKPVCPGCRRYFPPFPKKAKPKNHATCAMCRKYRRVVKHDDDGKPYCKLCAVRDRRAEVEEQDKRGWLRALATRQVELSKILTLPAHKDLFARFVEAEFSRTPPKTVYFKLKHHFGAFEALEQRLPDIVKATEPEFLDQFTGQEFRRWETVFAFLKESGYPVPSRDAREAAADRRRIESAVTSVAHCHDGFRVAAFAKHLKASNVKTRRVSVRAAAGLVQTRPAEALSQSAVTEFLKRSPGQRAALAAFLGFVRSQGLNLVLPAKRPARRRAPSNMKDLDACIAVLRKADDYGQLRAALAGAVVGLFGLELKTVLALPRSAVDSIGPGQLTLKVLGQDVAVDERLVPGFSRYLALRDRQTGGNSGPLFPGRVPTVSAEPSSLSYHFKEWGVSPRDLRMAGKAFLEKAGVVEAG